MSRTTRSLRQLRGPHPQGELRRRNRDRVGHGDLEPVDDPREGLTKGKLVYTRPERTAASLPHARSASPSFMILRCRHSTKGRTISERASRSSDARWLDPLA